MTTRLPENAQRPRSVVLSASSTTKIPESVNSRSAALSAPRQRPTAKGGTIGPGVLLHPQLIAPTAPVRITANIAPKVLDRPARGIPLPVPCQSMTCEEHCQPAFVRAMCIQPECRAKLEQVACILRAEFESVIKSIGAGNFRTKHRRQQDRSVHLSGNRPVRSCWGHRWVRRRWDWEDHRRAWRSVTRVRFRIHIPT